MKTTKTAVIVLGAPRSGTSAISHSLSAMGVNFGDPSRFVDASVELHNPIFFELKDLNKINDDVFASFGRSYGDFDFTPLVDDFDVERIDAFMPICHTFVLREFRGSRLIGLKDPRFCFTLPLWGAALQQLGYAMQCVWVLRPPEEVVASNAQVNVGWSWAHNVRIAALSTLAAAYVTNERNCLRVEYSEALRDPHDWVARAAAWLPNAADAKQLHAAEKVFNRGFRHVVTSQRPVPPSLSALYESAQSGHLDATRYGDLARCLRELGIDRIGDVGTAPVPPSGSGGGGHAELYVASAQGQYDAALAVRVEYAHLSPGSRLQFLLSLGNEQTLIRFDPADEPGLFCVRAISVGGSVVPDLSSRVRRCNQLLVSGPNDGSVYFASASGDPWLEVDVSGLSTNVDGACAIEVECFKCRAEDVFGALIGSVAADSQRQIALHVDNAVSPLRSELSSLKSTLVERVEELRAQLAHVESERHEREAALNARTNELLEQAARRSEELAAFREREVVLRADRERQTTELAESHEREESLRADQERQAKELAAAAERERHAQQVLFHVNTRVVDLQQRHGLLSARYAALQEEETALRKHDAALRKCREDEPTVTARLRAEVTAFRGELAAIHASALWRVLVLLQRLLRRLPAGFRRLLWRSAKAVWWAVTPWRIPARMRFQRQRRFASATVTPGGCDASSLSPAATAPDGPASLDVLEPPSLSELPEPPAEPGDRPFRGLMAIPSSGGYTYVPPILDPGALKAALAGLSKPPTFSVVVPVYNTDPDLLRRMVESVEAQWYPNWQLILADDHGTSPQTWTALDSLTDPRITVVRLPENRGISGATNAALSRATGDYAVFLDHDDELTPDCLYELALCIDRENPDYVYSDEDKLDIDGSFRDPFFKPDWSPDTLMSTMYTCHVSCVRRSLANDVGGLRSEYDGSQDWDFVLRVTERAEHVAHIPKVLYHWRITPASCASDLQAKPYAIDASKRAREDALQRRGLSGELVPVPELPGYFRTRYNLQGEPLFSIIIPSKNNGEVLKTCIDSIFDKTTYHRFEVIVVNNGSTDSLTLAYLAKLRSHDRVTVLDHDVPFNYSEINNFGVKHAHGEIFVFLNDDTEVIAGDWLKCMGGYAQLAHIGAVGAKLLYPRDHTIQHCGVVNLACGPSHAFVGMNASAPGYFNRSLLEYNWLAVTGACMMVDRSKFEAVGGFDEDLAVAYNDIELCLRLYERGWLHVVCPTANLIHYESLTRGYDLLDPAKRARLDGERDVMYRKHGDLAKRDPFYNPNLDPYDPHFGLRSGSRTFTACPSEGLTLPERPPAHGECALDAVNNQPVGDMVRLNRGTEATFVGWAGNGSGQAARAFVLVLKSDSGLYCASAFTGLARPDVVRALHRPGLGASGYRLTIMVGGAVPCATYAAYIVKPGCPDAGCRLPCEFIVE